MADAWTIVRFPDHGPQTKTGDLSAAALTYTYTPVEASSNVWRALTDGGTLVAIVPNTALASATGVNGFDPAGIVVRVSASAGVNLGLEDEVYAAAGFTVDAGTAGNIPIGRVVDFEPSSAGIVNVELYPPGVGNAHA